jgi:DNA-directed RNA polymerase subunit RPC12/RpoP
MEKRFTFKCWNSKCQQPYSLLREIEEGKPTLYVACPYCGEKAIAELDPHRRPVDRIYKNDSAQSITVGATIYDLPEILPTQPKP